MTKSIPLPRTAADRFQILSLDGGGLRGMYTAAVLACLEADLGIHVIDHFDLIAGTSTGGIIALGLGLGMSPREILDFYAKHGPRIFRDRTGLRSAKRFFRTKYSAGPLQSALDEILGDRLFGHSMKRLLITSYDIGAGDVHLFRTPHLPALVRDWREKAVDVAMSTTAAPTYFPGRPLDGARLIDGGMWANNPAMVALTEAIGPLGHSLGAVRIFSVGTTTDVPHRHRRLDRGGLLPWAFDAVDVLMRAQSDVATRQIRHFLGNDNFLRVNSTAPTGFAKLDSVDADSLIGQAGHESRIISPEFTRKFADHTASAYTPCHSPKEA